MAEVAPRDRPAGRVRRLVAAHPRLTGAAAIVGLAAIVFGIVWFEPHKLFVEETVSEAVPTADSDNDDSAAGSNSDPGSDSDETSTKLPPVKLASGSFQSLEHDTTGRAVLLELDDGSRFLRLEDLDTSNGPDLKVYLSEIPASDDWYAYGERFVDLGGLKGNRGDQNYAIPEDVDLSRFKSAVIWCRRFSVGFGVAPLDLTSA